CRLSTSSSARQRRQRAFAEALGELGAVEAVGAGGVAGVEGAVADGLAGLAADDPVLRGGRVVDAEAGGLAVPDHAVGAGPAATAAAVAHAHGDLAARLTGRIEQVHVVEQQDRGPAVGG